MILTMACLLMRVFIKKWFDLDVLKSILDALGILTDLAIQVDNKLMIDRLYQSVINEFKDNIMDFIVWDIDEELAVTVDRNLFLRALADLYFSLKQGMVLVVN